MLSTSIQNPICQNLIRIYSEVTLPSLDQIKKEAKRLIKSEGGYITKKGKKLTFINPFRSKKSFATKSLSLDFDNRQ